MAPSASVRPSTAISTTSPDAREPTGLSATVTARDSGSTAPPAPNPNAPQRGNNADTVAKQNEQGDGELRLQTDDHAQQHTGALPSPPKEVEALGPATDSAPFSTSDTAIDTSILSITLMLTTGARHPYKIDEKYLRNRKVDAVDNQGRFDPREMSAYKLKELIWTDWRSEWEPRPASPSSIRLICMGRMLEDKSPLKDFPFKLNDINVLHMTVKPADFLDDDETTAAGGKGQHIVRMRDGGERGAGCRCVIL